MFRYIATDRLKKLVAERNWRQKDFADIAGISRAQACAVINKRKHITPAIRQKILSIFPEENFRTLFFESNYCLNNNNNDQDVVTKTKGVTDGRER